jgi:hypothetical protein
VIFLIFFLIATAFFIASMFADGSRWALWGVGAIIWIVTFVLWLPTW